MTTAREQPDQLTRTWTDPRGFFGWFMRVQNQPLGLRFIALTFTFFLIAGVDALFIRTQLAVPENDFLSAQTYNELFTVHGTMMMFLFAVPIMEGFATLVLPGMLGARELPFPRLTAFGVWAFAFGGLLFLGSIPLGEIPDAGWFAYTPLSGPKYSPGPAIDFWLLGLGAAEIAGIGAAIELTIGVLRSRAPGMTLSRIPIFGWAILVIGFAILFAFTPLIVATTLLELDRKFDMQFFDAAGGGSPLLWQHLFWIFGHPDVYIQFIPAAAIVSMIVPTFVRRPIARYKLLVLAIAATGVVSFGLWVHHMFVTGLPLLALAFFTAASFTIAIASGIQVFAWIATIWGGRPRLTTPMLFVLGFLFTFTLGGITGVMVAAVPFDAQVHDTFFVVAHFHYVLIGGVVFPVFAALYYWFPQFNGLKLDDGLGKVNFWLVFLGFHLAFFPMHISGLLGMPRRVYTYRAGEGLEIWNLLSTIGAFVIASGVLIFMVNVVLSYKDKDLAGDDPWQAGTLEWATSTPTPPFGFRVIPIVHSRDPLWTQQRLDEGDPETERIVHGMAEQPAHFRAGLSTSALDARPEAIMRLSTPSLWPIMLAGTITLAFFAAIYDLYWIIVPSALTSIGLAIAWAWPGREERDAIRSGDGAEYHGLPVWVSDRRSYHWWAMVMILAVLSVALATFIYSYYYLRSGISSWPPAPLDEPDLWLPAANTLSLLAAAIAAWWAAGAARRGDIGRTTLGLLGSIASGTLFVIVAIFDLIRLDLQPSRSAYESLFVTIGGYQAAVVIGGTIMSAVVLAWTRLGYVTSQRNLGVANMGMFWLYAAASWIVVYAVLYLSPYVF